MYVVIDLTPISLLEAAEVLSQPLVVHHPVAAGFLRAAREGRPLYTNTFQGSACLIFIIVLLVKASHMAKPRVRVKEDLPKCVDTEREVIVAIFTNNLP